ncbi:MAG: peptidoglycan editing factor PgeF [Candidatus Omnitrophica bacterium]|nr:peptidoglycan editing factor PgeF [Candidatus Omnitrophota bacterium]
MPEQAISKFETLPFLMECFGPDVICSFSNRLSGNMSIRYADRETSIANRKFFLEKLGIDLKDLVCAKQVHSNNVTYAKLDDRGRGAYVYKEAINDTDAFITNEKNLPLAVFTADCLSIFLFDPKLKAIGLVHAGWRSIKENIAVAAIRKMKESFGTDASDIYAAFGPCIRSCCYEIGRELKEFFCKDIIEKDGRFYLDLINANKRQLLSAGVQGSTIFDCGICTSCHNDEYFSYRKQGNDCGRIISVIMLK